MHASTTIEELSSWDFPGQHPRKPKRRGHTLHVIRDDRVETLTANQALSKSDRLACDAGVLWHDLKRKWHIFSVSAEDCEGLAEHLRYVLNDIPAAKAEDKELEQIFVGLSKIWKESTSNLSIISRRHTHPTYRAILRMGPEIVPLILRDLQKNPDWWFEALELLTRDNPAKPDDSFQDAAEAWLNWGRKKNLID